MEKMHLLGILSKVEIRRFMNFILYSYTIIIPDNVCVPDPKFCANLEVICTFIISGYFYAPDDKDESVLSMCTDPDNDRLFTSDTQGNIKIWDIKNYCIKAEERVLYD